MKLAYIILAHKYPEQLLRMISRIRHRDVDCWIHIDRRANVKNFEKVLQLESVFMVHPRQRITWGSFSIVQAMTNGLYCAINSYRRYDYFHFLSGQDYPIQPTPAFIDYLSKNSSFDFAGNRPVEESLKNMERLSKYYVHAIPNFLVSPVNAIVNRLLPKRQSPFGIHLRKGPQWMTLTNDSVRHILDYIKLNPAYSKHFQYVQAADEFYFQTILFNSSYKNRLKNQIFHYIDWSENKKNPKTLNVSDLDKLGNKELFFARKFDYKEDDQILSELDKRLI